MRVGPCGDCSNANTGKGDGEGAAKVIPGAKTKGHDKGKGHDKVASEGAPRDHTFVAIPGLLQSLWDNDQMVGRDWRLPYFLCLNRLQTSCLQPTHQKNHSVIFED